MTMFERYPALLPLPAFEDNYIWLLHDQAGAVVVDPGEAAPILAWLEDHGMPLEGILVTHHHGDHTGGISELLDTHPCPVYGPAGEPIPHRSHAARDGMRIPNRLLGEIKVLAVPGHTRGHVAYLAGNWLFCGDTLFSCGCGRLFEGTPAQMHASLYRLAALPDETLVCCAHEYTLSNIRFARHVDPDNRALTEWETRARQLRVDDLPTLPVELGQEKRTNPFLRCHESSIVSRIGELTGKIPADTQATFTQLRALKDVF